MRKTVLITGGTDGIGKETAIALAKKGYTIHILGRNRSKGESVKRLLSALAPNMRHEFFMLDLSSMKKTLSFLDEYLLNYKKLDILVLNAGIFPKNTSLSEDGIDLSFSVGYISRYLFSVRLNSLLAKSENGIVVHVNGSIIGNIKFKQLSNPKYNKLSSVWQNSIGSALLVYFWKHLTQTNVAHSHWNPGVVNTQTVKSQNVVVQFLSKLAGMIEPVEAGIMLAEHIHNIPKRESAGKFYMKGKLQKPNSKIINGENMLNELITFSMKFTKVSITENIEPV